MNFSIASNWDDELVAGLAELNSGCKSGRITELFGSSAFSLFGSANAGLPNVGKKEIEVKIKKAHSLGFKFNYLVNAISYPELKTNKNHQEALDYFKWLESMAVDSVTIANEDILKFVQKNFPKLKVNISIVMGVKTVQEVNRLRKAYANIQRVILHHTINRDKVSILEHVNNSKIGIGASGPIEIELLANEICLYDCPRMKDHYRALSAVAQQTGEADFDWLLCAKIRAKNVREFLNSCWIRPEDAGLYQDIGVGILKIAGRKEKSKNLLMRAAAYLNNGYEGNVMDLFLAEFWPDAKPPFINNKKLDGYLELLWEKGECRLAPDGVTDIEYFWA